MKRAETKEKFTKFAKEICQDANLVEELGLGSTWQLAPAPFLCDFPEEIQEAYEEVLNQREFLNKLRTAVRIEVTAKLLSREVSTIKLVKWYFIFTEKELKSLFSEGKILSSNLKRLIIIDEFEKILECTIQKEDEDKAVARAVNKIYKALQNASKTERGGEV